jgi:hypothetical protein
MAQVSLLIQEALANHMPIGRHGMVVPGSYNPATATVDVMLCDAAIVFPGDQQTQPMVEQSVPLATTHIDDTYGPFGGEPCFLASVQGGYVAHVHRTPTAGVDSSNVPQGERWILLRNPAGDVIASYKMTQNGAGASDGLGGLQMLAGTLFKALTAAGRGITSNDSTQQTILGLPTGKRIIIDDAAGDILIGEAGLTANDRLVTESKLQTALNTIMTYINAHVHSGVQTGGGVSAVPTTTLSVTATGSSTVESEE